MKLTELSKTMSHALRHEPWIYELELDDEGWVDVSDLIQTLQQSSSKCSNIDVSTLQAVIDMSEKKRFEIKDNNIRAIYGHSIPGKLSFSPSKPPPVLYHGTTVSIADQISIAGIHPMSRQYVHLSTDINTAKEVAKRKSGDIVVFVVDSFTAYQHGIRFYKGNEQVWLANVVPPRYLNSIVEKNNMVD